MRHANKNNHLGRKAGHRRALLANMAISLLLHKRIKTTVQKARVLRRYIEPLLTKAKSDTTHSRRTVFSYLQNKEAIKELFDNVALKIANRPGGYVRILKTGFRLGDNAEMCIIELVDFNELLLQAPKAKKASSKRTRRSSGKTAVKATDSVAAAPVQESAVAEENTSNEEEA